MNPIEWIGRWIDGSPARTALLYFTLGSLFGMALYALVAPHV